MQVSKNLDLGTEQILIRMLWATSSFQTFLYYYRDTAEEQIM